MTRARPYHSPLREHQARQTRRMLLDAAAREIVANGKREMTMAAIAHRAGVSERTVYRHFPDRQALLDGLTEWVDDEIEARLGRNFEEPSQFTLDGLIKQIELVFVTMEAIGTPAEAMVIAAQSGPGQSERHDRRTRAFELLFDDALADVDEGLRRRVFGVTRVLFGSHTWYQLTRELGLSAQEAGKAVALAVATLVEKVRSGGG